MTWVHAVARALMKGANVAYDRANRARLILQGRDSSALGPRAVVAACWSFPIPSHVFVYQEIQALEQAGLDCRVFCCETNPRSQLPAAFSSLWRKRVVLRAERSINERDRDYFLRTRGRRVSELLDVLSGPTGLSPAELVDQSIVMMGFTFARYVELVRARYLHTYFFYDQSFMALMAGWLLQIPRGITAYADHMLNDYPFKCVPLHLELADIVVATSVRIKQELSAIGSGRFDSKIIVKPNGIDTSLFPRVCASGGGDCADMFELISVSRIEPKKGLIYLIQAVAILKDRGVPARLHIIGGADPHTPGSEECQQELAATIRSLNLSDSVVLHGMNPHHELSKFLGDAHVFVAPYVELASGDKDGIPTSILEAMSSGLPVVASDAGSILEAVSNGVEGLCVPQRDPVRLADAIERVLSDRAMFARMSDAARHRATTQFDVRVTERPLHDRIRDRLGQ